MSQLEFVFETAPWQRALQEIVCDGQLDGAQFLAIMESEDDKELEAALDFLEKQHVLINIDNIEFFADTADTAVRLRMEKELVQSNALPAGLPENDPLRLYLEELAALPATADIQLLADSYREGQDSLLPQLTNGMLNRVVKYAYLLAGRGVLLLDLLQEGGLGLWQGILSYEDGDFEAHCDWWIQQSLNKVLVLQAREFGVGQKLRQAMEDYRAIDEKLLGDLGRTPTVEELAQELHMSVQETTTVAQMLENARRIHFAKQEPKEEEEALTEMQAVEDTAYFQMRQRIADLLGALDDSEAKLLTLRFGLETGLPMSAEEVGKRLRLTPKEVAEKEAIALAKLRNEQ